MLDISKLNNLKQMAATHPTPFYLYDERIITERFNRLKRALPEGEIYYAMKSNWNPRILKLILKLGGGIDAVSGGETHMAMLCGFKASQIIYTPNGVTDEEMNVAVKKGILITIGSLSELKRLGQLHPGSRVSLRFNTMVTIGEDAKVQTGGLKSKFGILPDEIKEVASICKMFDLKVTGIHKHAGSGIEDTEKFAQSFNNLLKVGKKEYFPFLEFVDMGGGMKAPFHPEEKGTDLNKFASLIRTSFNTYCKNYGKKLRLLMEPGKYLTTESGMMVVKVHTLKNNQGRNIALTDGSFTHLIRPALYKAWHYIENLSNAPGEKKEYDICGNICETGDKFAESREITEIKEGDFLGIYNAGAYCYSMASTYNLRSLPGEVWVNEKGAETIRKAESPKELAQRLYGEYK